MNIFKKRETLAQNIAFMAIMAAINVVFVLMTTFVPFLLFLLVFLLPLSCTLVVLICKKKYFPIYAFATIGLCLIVTIWNISDTLFYIIPSIITGFIFALFIEKRIPCSWSIITATFVQFGLSYALLPLVKLITQVDLLDTFATLFGINEYEFLSYVEFFGVFFVSLLQEIVSYLFIQMGLKKLNYSTESKDNPWLLLIGLLFNLFATILCVFICPVIVFVFLTSSLYFGVFSIAYLIGQKRKINYILMVILFLISIFVFAGFYQYIQKPFGLLLSEIYLYALGIIVLINNCLKNKK